MEMYIGSKTITAKLMTRQEYNDFRGWDLPSDENGSDVGCLVEYIDGGEANTAKYSGFVSWSPKDVFDRESRQNGRFTFGDAIELMKRGKTMTRTGWNGRRSGGYPMTVWLPDYTIHGMDEPFFLMCHADDSVGVWSPVINDVLACDWALGEEEQ